MQCLVKVIEKNTQKTVETLGPMSKNAALRVERGVNINLNHHDYYTQIEEIPDEQNGEQNTNTASE